MTESSNCASIIAAARTVAARPAMANRYTRVLLTRDIKARLAMELDQGLAMEGLAILAGLQEQA